MRHRQELQISLLDRLIDHEPDAPAEPVQQRLTTLSSVGESVLRDLENLLNARRTVRRLPESDKQARASILGYGARDYSSQNPRSHAVRQEIRLEIQRLLQLFEPRLKNVSVRLGAALHPERALHFRIEAVLLVEPVTAPISFDTRFDINSGAYSVFK